MADGEYEEEDVWSYMKEKSPTNSAKRVKDRSFFSSSSSSFSFRRNQSSTMEVPKLNANANAEENCRKQRPSAPVKVPSWSKTCNRNAINYDELDDEDDENERVPPHEWIAQKLARNQISSFSVCEGAGRTLKGRDQRKVRNAVLSKTGFLE